MRKKGELLLMDTTTTLVKSIKHFFSGTMLSRITGVLRDMSMAYAFGAQPSVAAFFVAFRLAHLLRRVLGEGALQSAFIPKFEELRSDTSHRAFSFFADLYTAVSLVLSVLIFLSIGVLGGLLAYCDLSPGNREIIWLTLLMMPSLLFICLFGLNSSLLQCEKSYFIPSAAPVFFNVTWISGAVMISSMQLHNPMMYMAGVIICATLAQWAATLPQALKILRHHDLFASWTPTSFWLGDVKHIGKPLFLGVIGVAAAQVNNALDGIFARYADQEGPALLWYAIRIQQLPIGLFAVAFSGALLPALSRALKANDSQKFNYFLSYTIKKCLWIMIPFSIVIILFGKLGIQLVYGHGQFDEQAVNGTAQCLYAYALGLIPMALVIVIAPAFYSQNRYSIPTGASLFSVALNIGLNAFLVIGMGMGAVSVALATSFSSWANLAILASKMRTLTERDADGQKDLRRPEWT